MTILMGQVGKKLFQNLKKVNDCNLPGIKTIRMIQMQY